MFINLIADDSVSSAPAGFTAAVQAAANLFDGTFSDNITVNIRYGWGTLDNSADPNLTNQAEALGESLAGNSVSYSTLKSWLASSASALPVGYQATAVIFVDSSVWFAAIVTKDDRNATPCAAARWCRARRRAQTPPKAP